MILTWVLKRVGNANDTSLQSVAIATGGAIIFRTDFRQTSALPHTIIISEAGIKPISENKKKKLFQKRQQVGKRFREIEFYEKSSNVKNVIK